MSSNTENTSDIAPTIDQLEAEIVEKRAAKEAKEAGERHDENIKSLKQQLDDLQRERDLERANHADELNKLRINKIVASQASSRAPITTPGMEEANRLKAIAAAGGVAKYYQIPVAERCAMNGVDNSESVSDKQLGEIFGPKSNSLAAAQLMKNSPATYRIWKKIWIERRGSK